MPKKTHEKYITLRTSRAGSQAYEICIRKDGQTFRKSIKIDDFETRGAALEFACKLRDEMLVKMRAGHKISGFPTVRHLYVRSYELMPVSMRTRYRHDIYFRLVFEPYADIPINKITAGDIQASLNEFGKTHTRAESLKMFAVWHRIYKTAVADEYDVPDKSQSKVIQIPKGIPAKHRQKDISPEDLEKFIEALLEYNAASVSGSYNCMAVYYAIRIMQYCGTRPAETFALTRDDIDLKNNFIIINKSVKSTADSYLTISGTKTESSVRRVPIPEALLPILEKCLSWTRHDTILSKYNGQLWDIAEVDTLILNVRKKVKINFNLYMLRHQFSTDLMTQGTPPNIIRDLMGHTSEGMSLDYATSDEGSRAKAVNARVFGKK